MRFLNLFLIDCKRSIFSRRSAFAILGLTLILLLSVVDETHNGASDIAYYTFVSDFINGDFFFVIFAAVPGAVLFCMDMNSAYYRFLLTRISPVQYGVSKVISCFLSAVAVICISDFLFLVLLASRYPLIEAANMSEVFAFLEYFFVKSVVKGLFSGFLAVAALTISVKLTNLFVTLAIPLLLYQSLNLFAILAKVPALINVRYLSQLNLQAFPEVWQNLTYIVLFFVTLSAAIGALFTILAKRRFRNA